MKEVKELILTKCFLSARHCAKGLIVLSYRLSPGSTIPIAVSVKLATESLALRYPYVCYHNYYNCPINNHTNKLNPSVFNKFLKNCEPRKAIRRKDEVRECVPLASFLQGNSGLAVCLLFSTQFFLHNSVPLGSCSSCCPFVTLPLDIPLRYTYPDLDVPSVSCRDPD